MARIPFKRITEAFDETARARLCQSSSGSDYSADDNSSSAELSDLIDSFFERNEGEECEKDVRDDGSDSESGTGGTTYSSSYYSSSSSEAKETLLKNLFISDVDDNGVKGRIRSEIERAWKSIVNQKGEEGFKRQLMSQLRQRGFDAGLCKSRWKKIGQFPAGDYEYIDIMVNETRYIIEVNLVGEFIIARPSNHYQSLLDIIPTIYIGEPDNLKQVVKLMCTSLKKSMKNEDMHVPPWRRNGYMLAKWFGSYKRTTNSSTKKNGFNSSESLAKKQSVGFEMSPAIFQNCRGELGRKTNLRVGNLAQMFDMA
ncbi:Duf506 family protein [Thalictrum thalictroides]|uniref:Duf506 family protein n=1 Tax=Thalictrum thalictroides TaxID=46969 RepID=A0A7J6VEQ0_THATH|nr:Duf506 family protein [Thalictrum thalictroides]